MLARCIDLNSIPQSTSSLKLTEAIIVEEAERVGVNGVGIFAGSAAGLLQEILRDSAEVARKRCKIRYNNGATGYRRV